MLPPGPTLRVKNSMVLPDGARLINLAEEGDDSVARLLRLPSSTPPTASLQQPTPPPSAAGAAQVDMHV